MKRENKRVKPFLFVAIDIPAGMVPSASGDYVAQVVREEYNVMIVPYTITAIKNAAIQGEKEKKKLRKVQLSFYQKSSPAELSFEWAKKETVTLLNLCDLYYAGTADLTYLTGLPF